MVKGAHEFVLGFQAAYALADLAAIGALTNLAGVAAGLGERRWAADRDVPRMRRAASCWLDGSAARVDDAQVLVAELAKDAGRVLDHLGSLIQRASTLAGGVNAYRLATHPPHLVCALIIEDIGAEVDDDLYFRLSRHTGRRIPGRGGVTSHQPACSSWAG
ncbi:hypothetical protein ACWCQN_38890 [Streptomyces sp. NPDC001984]|uniref:hypothetical protein n=1 Tax=Streptomyces sp. NPDC002619 TaxID=3364655 RepID=UPI0036AED534